MTDYSFHCNVLRDDIAEAIADNIEHAPYVLAEIAGHIAPCTVDFDDFCDGLEDLMDDQQEALLIFCQRVAAYLEN
jgi:hypothetical protein